jgi:hypothetical protein
VTWTGSGIAARSPCLCIRDRRASVMTAPRKLCFRRSRRDRAPYPIWREQGLLMAAGGTTDFK